MSEKIYAVLLRLFPSRFRARYGEEALQLFRDRARHETGSLRQLRLWFDLFTDLAVALPREYRYAQRALAPASAVSTGLSPTFFVLADKSPRPGALAIGGVLSLSAILAFSAVLSRVSVRKPPRQAPGQTYRAAAAKEFSAAAASATASHSYAEDASQESLAPATPAAASRALPAPQQAPSQTPAAGEIAATEVPQAGNARSLMLRLENDADVSKPMAAPRDSNSGKVRRVFPASAGQSDLAAERHRVVSAAAANLTQFYVDRELAQKTAEALVAHEQRGDDNAAATGAALAELLTKQMREVSHDAHLDLIYSEQPLPEGPRGTTPEASARYRSAMQESNCTFEKVEMREPNIGYLKLNSFPEVSVCRATAESAMRRLNNADAIIFDLRDNRGGQPEMVMFLAAYLFDHPEYMYNPRENTSLQNWTKSPVPGNQLGDKPAFILISPRTISAAEHFSYDLKMLKRATLVGETTGGAAHAGVFHRLDEHFGMGIPEVKPINPFADSDWAAVGIAPDVNVPAAQALETALQLAQHKTRRK